ncbi:MAG: YjfI family protein [Aestuariibacter sp.]|nr:YjfI family protein [Aestuariibacter sp.]
MSENNVLSVKEVAELLETIGSDVAIHGSVISFNLPQYGDLSVIATVGDKQITAEIVICPTADVADVNAANDAFMRLQKPLPLSSIAIETINGEDNYVVFGALSSTSKLSNVALEVNLLAVNALNVAELIQDELSA